MTTLTFCKHQETLDARVAALGPEAEKPYLLTSPYEIKGAIQALEEGKDVLGLASASTYGWRAPKGVEVKVDDDLADDISGLRDQALARRHFDLESTDGLSDIYQSMGRMHQVGRPIPEVEIVSMESAIEGLRKKLDTDDGPGF
ncbi:MAG: hypothetical protein ABJN42_31680 [Roseibium sp.]|uniref:hypothetical protein n=1 Tax=Roseibium sp. TaxID=1936156 RepID=UPI0032995C58